MRIAAHTSRLLAPLQAQPTTTPPPTPEPSGGSDTVVTDGIGSWIALAVLVFGALTLWALYRYLNAWRSEFMRASDDAARARTFIDG